jgi:hypothetical protein
VAVGRLFLQAEPSYAGMPVGAPPSIPILWGESEFSPDMSAGIVPLLPLAKKRYAD